MDEESPDRGPPEQPPLAIPADTAGRKAFLLGLVPRLSLNEIWMLQAQLAGLDLRADVFGRLPPELQIMVADQLGPVDLGCCLDVSPAWRQAFLHESVRRGQARRCFPALLEYTSAVEQADPDPLQVDRIFTDTARKYAARARGRFRVALRHLPRPSMAVLADEGDEQQQQAWSWRTQKQKQKQWPAEKAVPVQTTQDDAGFDGPEYAHGRLFWQLYHGNTAHILVDDLRSGRRRHLAVRDDIVRGERFMMCSFGDEMVVIAFTGTRL